VNRIWPFGALTGLLCCLLAGAVPAQSAAPGRVYSWSEFPDLELLQGKALGSAEYPQWEPAALLRADYSETQLAWLGRKAVLTCEAGRDGYVSVIRYGRDGLSRVTHFGLPLPRGQVSSLTLDAAEPSAADVVRLVLWQSPPTEIWLAQLASHPNWLAEPVPDLVAQRWFQRARKLDRGSPPWVDDLRPVEAPVSLTGWTEWPLCRATLTTNGVVHGKDCAVVFDGVTALGIDDYGSYGQWVLDWSSRFELSFELPGVRDWGQAELQLYGGQRALYQLAPGPGPEVTVNGWPVSTLGVTAYGADTQPIALPVSQYLEEGGNQIVLRMGSLAGTEWLLDGIELWAY